MKFKIKYADQIVGFFSLLALVLLIILIFAIGVKQNWFTKKNHYYTVFDSGSGVSVGMDLTYKGFSIGKVSKVSLVGQFVRVDYYVLEDYFDYVKEYSIVELSVSPIGLGSSFILHPGSGKSILPPNCEIFRKDSVPAQRLIDSGLVFMGDSKDSIGILLGKVSNILDDVHQLIGNLNDALEGNGDTPFTEIIENLNQLTNLLSDKENGAVPNLLGTDITKNLSQTLENLNSMMNDSTGAIPRLLGVKMSNELNSILQTLTPILSNADNLVEKASPEVNELLAQVNTLLLQVEDLVTGLNNNPLLRGGIPDKSNTGSVPVQSRSTDF